MNVGYRGFLDAKLLRARDGAKNRTLTSAIAKVRLKADTTDEP